MTASILVNQSINVCFIFMITIWICVWQRTEMRVFVCSFLIIIHGCPLPVLLQSPCLQYQLRSYRWRKSRQPWLAMSASQNMIQRAFSPPSIYKWERPMILLFLAAHSCSFSLFFVVIYNPQNNTVIIKNLQKRIFQKKIYSYFIVAMIVCAAALP